MGDVEPEETSGRRAYARERRKAAAERRLREIEQRKKDEAQRERVLMGGREFTGHNPPSQPTPDLGELEQHLGELPVVQVRHIAELWDDAYAAIEEVLNDDNSPPTAKIQAAKIVQAAKEASERERLAQMPTRVVFETAAYVPPDAA